MTLENIATISGWIVTLCIALWFGNTMRKICKLLQALVDAQSHILHQLSRK